MILPYNSKMKSNIEASSPIWIWRCLKPNIGSSRFFLEPSTSAVRYFLTWLPLHPLFKLFIEEMLYGECSRFLRCTNTSMAHSAVLSDILDEYFCYELISMTNGSG